MRSRAHHLSVGDVLHVAHVAARVMFGLRANRSASSRRLEVAARNARQHEGVCAEGARNSISLAERARASRPVWTTAVVASGCGRRSAASDERSGLLTIVSAASMPSVSARLLRSGTVTNAPSFSSRSTSGTGHDTGDYHP